MKKLFVPKIWGWKPDRASGMYPLPRIAWNLMWYLPLQTTHFLFCVCILACDGSKSFKRVWEDTL